MGVHRAVKAWDDVNWARAAPYDLMIDCIPLTGAVTRAADALRRGVGEVTANRTMV
jgi:hypothetical protein